MIKFEKTNKQTNKNKTKQNKNFEINKPWQFTPEKITTYIMYKKGYCVIMFPSRKIHIFGTSASSNGTVTGSV